MGESEASSEAVVLRSDQQAADAIEEFSEGMKSDTVEDCVQDLIEEAVRDEDGGDARFEIGDIDVGELSFTPPDVDEARAWQIAIPIEVTSGAAEGLSPTVYLERVLLREGDRVATVTTEDVLTEFDSELRELARSNGRPPPLLRRLRGDLSGSPQGLAVESGARKERISRVFQEKVWN